MFKGVTSWLTEALRAETPPAPLADGGPPIPRPLHADWVWRPAPWAGPVAPAEWERPVPGTRLSPEVAVFHDCPVNGLAVARETGSPAPLLLTPDGFGGAFLSLAVDLPRAALAGLGRSHILALHVCCVDGLPPGTVARLNLRQGVRTHRLTRDAARGLPVEFDLAALPLGQQRVAAGWVDLILAAPVAAPVRIADFTLSRRPRAEP